MGVCQACSWEGRQDRGVKLIGCLGEGVSTFMIYSKWEPFRLNIILQIKLILELYIRNMNLSTKSV